MGAKIGGTGGPQADINITPLVDIVLVLLIIFMVIAPMLEKGADVKLPKVVNAVSKQDSADDLILSVNVDGTIFLDVVEISAEDLEKELEGILLAEPFKPILIKGDVESRYVHVRKVMEICERSGAKAVGLMSDKNTPGPDEDKDGG
jgi:biopolymer transport protein ExbD